MAITAFTNSCAIQITGPNTLKVSAGAVRNDLNTATITLSAAVTINVDDSGALGLDTGSIAASTWYFVYLIDGATQSALVSTSDSGPTLPSGYTSWGFVGAVYRRADGRLAQGNLEDAIGKPATIARAVGKLWAADAAGDNADTVTVADAGGDTTTWPLLATAQTGNLGPATDAGLTYNATTNVLTAAGGFVGDLTGNAATVTVADAAGDTTTFPMLATAATGSLAPATDAGLSYNATTNVLTAGGFAGPLTGNVTGNVTGTASGNMTVIWDSGALAAPAASIDTNDAGLVGAGGALSTGYKAHILILVARGAAAADAVALRLTINNDTTDANYQNIARIEGTAAATETNANRTIGSAPAGNASAGNACGLQLTVPFPEATTFHKWVSPSVGSDHREAGPGALVEMRNFRWKSTSAVTRYAISASSGNLDTGSRLMVLGIP